MTRRTIALLALLAASAAAAPAAHAEGVGVYAPTAPFSGPVARLEFASRLAEIMGPGIVGRAYAKAGDFAAAVKRGEIGYALVDASYVAAIGAPWTVLAVARRGGASEVPWAVVSSRVEFSSLAGLRGKSVIVPAIGAKDEAFVLQVLLEGELPRDFFARLSFAPDALSALAAVERGRADCALVPSGLPLPGGVHQVATLRAVSWPVLVTLPRADERRGDAMATALVAASGRLGGQAFDGFVAGGGPAVRALVGQFAHESRRPPFVVPPLRLGGLAGGLAGAAILPDTGTYKLGRVDGAGYLVSPKPGRTPDSEGRELPTNRR